MAIQNFLSGGFYGKLGDVVGQRWHNKRTVRAYVIPANPRTEKQQSNRQIFALATFLAQQAYNINKGSPLWDTSQMGQFSLMVGTAKRRLQAGKSIEEALPLYPDGYNPTITLTQPQAIWAQWPTRVYISNEISPSNAGREMEVIIHCKNEMTQEQIIFTDTFHYNPNAQFLYSFEQSNLYSLPAGSSFQAVSKNDAQFNNVSIIFPVFQITQPSRPFITINLSFTQFVYDPTMDAFPMTLQNMPFIDDEFVLNVHCYNDSDSAWEDIEIDCFLSGGKLELALPADLDYTYPAGSKIIGGQFTTYVSGTANITLRWSDWAFTAL